MDHNFRGRSDECPKEEGGREGGRGWGCSERIALALGNGHPSNLLNQLVLLITPI